MILAHVVYLLSLLVGCLYPAFASYKILNSQPCCDVEVLRMWLSYWIVYGVYVGVDYLTGSLGTFIPFLNEFKLLFLFWLLPTVGGGSLLIYGEILRSFFSNNELSIDQVITWLVTHGTLTGGQLVGKLLGSVLDQLMSITTSCFGSRGQSPALKITPSIEDLVKDVIAKRQLKKKGKQRANLYDTINEVLGDKTDRDRDSTLSGLDLLGESESDLLVIKNHIAIPKDKPQTPPKPKRLSSLCNQEVDIKAEIS
ncbi:receptor expression-enhancing protein 6 isoform X1 [Drosophila gunungcola]|uniref:receptor expression-enhancing protein 6 isoform X1 n=1 Tax=Drosophila gunungcola TaxID=103775 RepID=UPI0022E916D3|nr:receptor expression-enhancing protein 6 isoform X1 [Drosophila gunungcola]